MTHTLGRWTTDHARLTPDKVAIDERGRRTTYAELDARATALAGRLATAGYRPGDRIATVTRNSTDHVVLFFACAKTGLTLAPLSWRLAGPELGYLLSHARPALVAVQPEFAGAVTAALTTAAPACHDDPPAVELLGAEGIEQDLPPARHDDDAPPARPPRDEDPLLLVYTSGSSARPRGVLLSHANCFWTNVSLSGMTGMTKEDVVLCVLPQFHVGGWNIQPLLAWWRGATVVLEPDFDAGSVLHLLSEDGVTTMMGVPAHYRMLAEHPDFAGATFGGLTHLIVGGAPMPVELLELWHARGVRVVQGYGLTEAAPNVLVLPPQDAITHVGSVGKPYPNVEVALRDPATGAVLEGPARGELLVRGPAVFAGYADDPAATAEALRDGWLHTGDLAERDAEGYFRIVDRRSSIYISGGENVSPAEVEAVLRSHPAVAEAAVVPVPDERWGEAGHALVVRAPATDPTAEELLAHCRAHLAVFKLPRSVRFVRALPRTELAKVRRRDLIALLEEPS